MVKFIQVSPDDIPNFREPRKGRVSYPILKAFLDSGMVLARMDREGIQRSVTGLSAGLTAYIKSHDLPVKLFVRDGEIHLLRLDLNDDGTPNPDYQPPSDERRLKSLTASDELQDRIEEIETLTPEVIKKRSKST
ncbi:hypothetical protein M0R72_16610 [Candidatus Pacearchaeota archaeon]|jgi:hypothetical protein|nr:hypothetical protein [Candidatus Pacearchaeota archaeon]